jgi:hypothetical protein
MRLAASRHDSIHLLRRASNSSSRRCSEDVRLKSVEWALLKVIRYRVAIFKGRFGRQPGRNEPLFFDERYDTPVAADMSEVRRQIHEAARAHRIKENELLAYLRIRPS